MRILILCTGNSCRSQMAHGLLESFDKNGTIEVYSAGTRPAQQVNPLAVEAMQEIGIDISAHTPHNVNEYLHQEWDYVITVCGGANESCPTFTGKVKQRLHMGFEDPSEATGTQEFEEKIKNGEFVEYEEVYAGSYYGTLVSEVERIWAKGNIIIFDIDVKGGVNLKKLYGDNALAVFIQPPSVEELRNRLVGRGTDALEAIERRVAKATEELTYADKFDVVLINDQLEEALAKAEQMVAEFQAK